MLELLDQKRVDLTQRLAFEVILEDRSIDRIRLFCLPLCARLGNCSPVPHTPHAKVVNPMGALLTSFVNSHSFSLEVAATKENARMVAASEDQDIYYFVCFPPLLPAFVQAKISS